MRKVDPSKKGKETVGYFRCRLFGRIRIGVSATTHIHTRDRGSGCSANGKQVIFAVSSLHRRSIRLLSKQHFQFISLGERFEQFGQVEGDNV